jgi:hypothetical protein
MIRDWWLSTVAYLKALRTDLVILAAGVWACLPAVAVFGMVVMVMWALLKMGEGR